MSTHNSLPETAKRLFRPTGAADRPACPRNQLHGTITGCSGSTRHILRRYADGWRTGWRGQTPDVLAGAYVFRDPFVGTFNRHALPDYLELLASISGRVGRTDEDLIRMSGPMEWKSSATLLTCWREVPDLGLSGVSEIAIAGDRVIRESVSYDLNVASEALREVHSGRAENCFRRLSKLLTCKEY